MSIPEILLDAAKVVEERGWCQGGWVPVGRDTDPNTCPVCVLAAINVATGTDTDEPFEAVGERQDAALALADFLGLGDRVAAVVEEGIETVVGNGWNDDPSRTPEQVITALRECAAELSKADA